GEPEQPVHLPRGGDQGVGGPGHRRGRPQGGRPAGGSRLGQGGHLPAPRRRPSVGEGVDQPGPLRWGGEGDMKYLAAFLDTLNSGDPWEGYPTKPTKPPAAPEPSEVGSPSNFRGIPPEAPYKTYETHSDASSVGFVGDPDRVTPEFWGPVDVEEI